MIKSKPVRVLVVDDTVVYRKIVSDILAELPQAQVVGTAHNGRAAMARIASLKPDLLILDIEMPEMSGLEVLEQIKSKEIDAGAVMLSTLTQEGGAMTMKALELGAFDFIPKPHSGSIDENKLKIKKVLAPMLAAFARSREIKKILKGNSHRGAFAGKSNATHPVKASLVRKSAKKIKSEIIAIGISTGGPKALAAMMPKLPSELGVPIVIVQHMPPVFTKSLAKSLNSKCKIEVREAVDGEPVLSNTALIAPGGKQMKIVAGADGRQRVIKITDDPPENSCKPSVDYLFRSVAHHYVGRATGVIMTGMGSDGTKGLKLMHRNGAAVIAQDASSCVVYGMPKEPVEAGIVDVIAPLDKIADEICKTLR